MRKDIPSAATVIKRLGNFKKFLSERGAELLLPTNEWEVLRFKTGKGVAIVYRSKDPDAKCSFIGDAQQAWFEFINPETKWRAIPPTKRKPMHSVDYRTVRDRDGNECFFCAEYVSDNEATIEHLVSLCHGGTQHISNKFLAHKDCNAQAGNLSAPEKILMYHKSRLEKLLRRINEQGRRDREASNCDLTQSSGEARQVSRSV